MYAHVRTVGTLLVRKEEERLAIEADQHGFVSLLVPCRGGTVGTSQHFLSLYTASLLRLLEFVASVIFLDSPVIGQSDNGC